MTTPPGASTPTSHASHASRAPAGGLIAVARWTRYCVLILGGLLFVVLTIGTHFVRTAAAPISDSRPAQAPLSDQLALDIMPVKPGGPATGYAAYLPTTVLSAPAQRIVTVTIRNFDLDPVPTPADSPVTQVQGTVGGVAYADGKAYTVLDRMQIAHTFTVPALHLNVPIPGVSASGKPYVAVTFRFRTGVAGVYAWRCMAPCGEGQDRQAGPMADERYMRGALDVIGSQG